MQILGRDTLGNIKMTQPETENFRRMKTACGRNSKTSLPSHIQWETAPEHRATPNQTFLNEVITK